MKYFKHLLLLNLISISWISFAQTFDWKEDGYSNYSSGGFYKDIDGSGVHLKIEGLVNDEARRMYVRSGKDDQNAQKQIHTYTFSFSENVDIEFTISDINLDTIKNCFDDELTLSGNPNIIESKGLKIIGDTLVHPYQIKRDFDQGNMTVQYQNVKQFKIRHGSGRSCNPGYVLFSPIKFQKTQRLVQFGADTLHFMDILFESGQKQLNKAYNSPLDSLVALMKDVDTVNVILLGFADDRENGKNNAALSRKRVNSVLAYLLLNGIDRSRIEAQYFGENIPEKFTVELYGSGQNKRVEIYTTQ
jgi:outer membrane protein OmpA-like peptidoglycan-associated protein